MARAWLLKGLTKSSLPFEEAFMVAAMMGVGNPSENPEFDKVMKSYWDTPQLNNPL